MMHPALLGSSVGSNSPAEADLETRAVLCVGICDPVGHCHPLAEARASLRVRSHHSQTGSDHEAWDVDAELHLSYPARFPTTCCCDVLHHSMSLSKRPNMNVHPGSGKRSAGMRKRNRCGRSHSSWMSRRSVVDDAGVRYEHKDSFPC